MKPIHLSCSIDVIAGGGTAGLVLANRLSENPKINVAVLEAVSVHYRLKPGKSAERIQGEQLYP